MAPVVEEQQVHGAADGRPYPQTHVPKSQISFSGQRFPQTPQWSALNCRATHMPSQQV